MPSLRGRLLTLPLLVTLASAALSAPALAAGDPALSEGSLAVLDFSNKISTREVSAADARYFADSVRGAALKALPRLKVMTRENLLVLLQANGKDLASCEGECEVETGRRIGADLVITGELLKLGTNYKLDLRLHETRGGTMLSGEIASGKTVDELDENTKAAVARLLAPLTGRQPLVADNRSAPLIQDRAAPVPTHPTQAPNELPLPDAAAAPGDTVHRHLGFQLHADLGAGYLSTSEGDSTFSGPGGAFGIEAGYAFWENTLLGLRVSDAVAVLGSTASSSGSGTDSSATLTSVIVAPTITHYFMPLDLFISGSIGISTLSVSNNGLSSSANAGLGARAAIGKEWWVSDHWGLGALAQLQYAENGDSAGNLSTIAFSLAFSATWN